MASVLIIDDSAEMREVLRLLLISLGHKVIEAESGAQGLRAYQTDPADVVLLDIFMPDKDGLETLRDLLQHDPNARVIAMTGGGTYKNMGILQPALLLGARKILYKPISPLELKATIEEALALPK